MSEPIDGHGGERYLLVDAFDLVRIGDDQDAQRFLDGLPDGTVERLDARSFERLRLPDLRPGASPEEARAVLAAAIGSGRLVAVRLQPAYGRLDPVRSVRLSDLIDPKDDPVPIPAPAPVVRPTWIEIRLLGRHDVSFPGAPIEVRLPDGTVRTEVLDGDSWWRAHDVPEKGTCHLRLLERPPKRGARPPEQLPDGLPVLRPGDASIPLVTERAHTVIVEEPRAACVRLVGMMFALNKAFLLPEALEGIRLLGHMYAKFPEAEVLVVGHTDTTGTAGRNLSLSLERAEAVVAYLRDDLDAWLRFYGKDTDYSRRWGAPEDLAMLSALPRGGDSYYGEHHDDHCIEAAIRRFQVEHGLPDSGKADTATRRALVAEYMDLDETTLPEDTTIVAHGCGQHFLAIETDDGVSEPDNRRVEVFFFKHGIDPQPPKATSPPDTPHYPAWLEAIEEERTFKPSEQGTGTLLVVTDIPEEMADASAPVFHLASADGSFDVTVTPADGEVEHEFIVFRFRDLPRGAFYTLTVMEVSGATTTLFDDVPYPELAGVSSSLDSHIIDPFDWEY
jgi:hypothetical protein